MHGVPKFNKILRTKTSSENFERSLKIGKYGCYEEAAVYFLTAQNDREARLIRSHMEGPSSCHRKAYLSAVTSE
jgi:hypothetical protein